MRIIAGALRGRLLIAPPGIHTRPSSIRLRQALFDIMMHAGWGGQPLLSQAHVLDLFAGTGALGLEALSRGAAFAEFFEQDAAAAAALQHNINSCRLSDRTRLHRGDACQPPIGPAADLVFLDPPYGLGLVDRALQGLQDAGRIGPTSCIIAELGLSEPEPPFSEILATRRHGAGRIVIGRLDATHDPS